jgi:hypothetical protein
MTEPRESEAYNQVVALAKRLRHDPEFLSHVEGIIAKGQASHQIDVADFMPVFQRSDVVEAMRGIQRAAQDEQLEPGDLVAIPAREGDAFENAVAAAIVAAAASTAAAAFV